MITACEQEQKMEWSEPENRMSGSGLGAGLEKYCGAGAEREVA